jgi:ATP-dependent DNA ligase
MPGARRKEVFLSKASGSASKASLPSGARACTNRAGEPAPGRRTRSTKVRNWLYGGYRVGPNGFDNLAVGYYERSKLMFIAKVRNGFTPERRRKVAARFKGLETTVCPFANLPEPKNARRDEALTAEAMLAYRWLKPRLVAEIDFADWTDANHLRHSRFVGLRDDKDPKEVVREVER